MFQAWTRETGVALFFFICKIIKIKPSRNLYGKVYPATEIFPHDEAFGYWAWTFRDYDDAKQRFKELEEGKHS